MRAWSFQGRITGASKDLADSEILFLQVETRMAPYNVHSFKR